MAFNVEYKTYIKSDRWNRKCERYWLRKGRSCKACGKTDGPLHVHHLSYENLGFEPLTDLIGLCYDCHHAVHSAHRRGGRRESIRTVTMRYVRVKRRDRLRKRR